MNKEQWGIFLTAAFDKLHGLFKREEPDMLSHSDKTGEF